VASKKIIRKRKHKGDILVIERHLGQYRAAGLSWGHGRIEVDPRQSSKDYMDTIIHEILHERHPELTEDQVLATSTKIAEVLQDCRFHRICS